MSGRWGFEPLSKDYGIIQVLVTWQEIASA